MMYEDEADDLYTQPEPVPPPVDVSAAIDTTDGVIVAARFFTSKAFVVSSSGERPLAHLPSADK